MNIKKPILLFLALLLPIAIFVFLKFFGQNEFEVPPLFVDKIEQPAGCEGFTYIIPYGIPDSIATTIQCSGEDSISLVVFIDPSSNQQEMSIQLNRIFTEFSKEKFKVVALADKAIENIISTDKRFILSVEPANKILRHCVFLLNEENNTVLLDSKRRIRGHYTLTNREEADRLILEMKIILKQY
jgi:hypothetical protein